MDESKRDVLRHYQAAASNYSDQYSSSYEGYPANLRRLELLLKRVQDLKAETLLDCGCGEGTPMLRILDSGVMVWGFDFVQEMVKQAKLKLETKGLKDHVWQGNIADPSSFRPPGIMLPERFDVCIAMGVFPHLEDEAGPLGNMASATRRGGRVFVEFRNELFALFTFNRLSYRLFCDKLIRVNDAELQYPEYKTQLEEITAQLRNFFRLDLPSLRAGTADAPGYDEILSKFRNPFEIGDLFARAGLRTTAIHFYHYHAIPPLFENNYGKLFRTLSLNMESNSSDWRGNFMASAFVVEAVKE
jgi:2-polyprenyl-3-methyl-5-hydroxy-6-metoxy-1,4-benzoquinol methylase